MIDQRPYKTPQKQGTRGRDDVLLVETAQILQRPVHRNAGVVSNARVEQRCPLLPKKDKLDSLPMK